MKRALCLLLICLFCTGCSALPPEERAFCVVLLVDGGAQECTVRVRIPDIPAERRLSDTFRDRRYAD